jgi:hypothetical protein
MRTGDHVRGRPSRHKQKLTSLLGQELEALSEQRAEAVRNGQRPLRRQRDIGARKLAPDLDREERITVTRLADADDLRPRQRES